MGVVYKAHDPGINRPVAIKTIRKALIEDGRAASNLPARFRNEAQAVGRMSHPGIVGIYEYGEDETTAFIAMEFVQGRDLAKILAVTPTLPEPMVLRFMHQLLDALDCAHRHGVWHRDIKPANLIITANGQLKITDFGVARIDSVAITQVAAAIGTPGYMAPEQYIGETIDHRVDIFAAGVLLYRLLCGQPPFTGSAETVMYKILNKDPVPLSQLPPPGGISPLYDAIISRALAKDPNARFESASQFSAALANRAGTQSVRTAADDTTIILPLQRMGQLDDPASWALGTGATQPIAPTGWDTATLAPFETALTRFMGPMARVVVRQAAKNTADLRALQDALAEQIPDAADRAKFAALVNAGSKGGSGTGTVPEPAVGSSGSNPTLAATQMGGTDPITPEVLDHARAVLANHVGPIAKIVLKKALTGVLTPEQLFGALVQQIGDQTDRVRLLEELRRKPKK